jgi:glycosyltransferase involved in cell wall biosynthesis
MQANILVLTHWSYKDALVQTYTLPYVQTIRNLLPLNYSITLVTSEQEHLALSPQEADVTNQQWKVQNMKLVALPYTRFGWKKMLKSVTELFALVKLIKREKIQVIHAFCTPAGSIGYVLSRITGTRLVVDSYEPHAESMVENKTWKPNGAAYRLLHQLERWQTKRAFSLIATAYGMKQYAKEQFGVDVKRFYVKPACVDLEKFSPRGKNQKLLEELGLVGKIVCVYAGKLGGIYLKEEVFDFIKCCYDSWGETFRFVMLTNASLEEIHVERTRVGLPENIVLSRFVLHEEVPSYLSLGDFAINPVKPVPTKRYCTSIKDGEYWAMGLPVVITSNISDDSDIIEQHEIGYVLKTLSEPEYRKAVQVIAELLQQDRPALQSKIHSVAERYRNFGIAKEIYRSLYKN